MPGPGILDKLEDILSRGEEDVRKAGTLEELEEARLRYLGRKGELTSLLRSLGSLPPEERRKAGRRLNESKERLETLFGERERELRLRERERELQAEALDVTLPGRRPGVGREHPLRRVWSQVVEIFRGLGYEVYEGPEVEYDYYNFEALNIPRGHPAREMQDSFYLTPEVLLRTHTSPAQIRFMRSRAPRLPVRMISPGRVFRRDDDATHSPVFHQVEGLLVDRGVSFAHLKGTLLAFARGLYGPEARIRLRPSYFPFTEPSAEVDISCAICRGEGGSCRTCKGSGWLEVLGAGMVHPEVLRNGGYDPREVTGFAFGMGLERLAMLKWGVDDLRLFFQNDLRFLRQF